MHMRKEHLKKNARECPKPLSAIKVIIKTLDAWHKKICPGYELVD